MGFIDDYFIGFLAINQNKNINKLIYSRLQKNKTTFATL